MFEYYHDSSDRQPPMGGFFGQIFGQPIRPPFGQPFTPPGQPGGGPPFGPPSTPPGQSSGPPSGPPPSFVPQQPAQGPGVFAVDPGAIRPCVFRYIYIWLTTGEQFWAWLVFVGPRSAAGWRWTGFRWIYFGIDLKNIDRFVCY